MLNLKAVMPQEMTEALITIVLFFSVVFLRAIPRLCVDKGKLPLSNQDTWFHLLFSEEIRQNNHLPPKRVSGFLLSESVTYPPLFHMLLSYLDKRRRTAIEPFLGGISDGVVGSCLFFVAHFYISLDIRNSVFVSLLFVFAPYAPGLNFGPRANLGTPRVFGQLLFFLTVVMVVQFLATGYYHYGLLAVGLGSLIFSASMFSSQAYVFILIIWSVLLPSFYPITVLLSSYVLSAFVTRGYTWHISWGHIQHLRIMAKTFWKGRFATTQIQQRNRIRDLINLPKYLLTAPKQAFDLLYVRNSFLVLLFQIPVISLYVYCRFVHSNSLSNTPLIHLLDTLFISGLLVFLAASTKPLLFLGEAERYIEHIAPFISLFVGLLLPILENWEVHWVLFYSISLYMVNGILFVSQVKTTNSVRGEQHTQSVLDWINSEAPQKRFAVLPNTNLNVLIPYLTTGSVLFGQWKNHSSPAIKSLKDVESDDFRKYWPSLLEQYAIDYIIIPIYAPAHPNMDDLRRDFPIVFQNSTYTIHFRQK